MLGKKKITLAYPDERLQLKDSLTYVQYIQSFSIDRPRPARSKAFIIINSTGVRSNYGGGTPQVFPPQPKNNADTVYTFRK